MSQTNPKSETRNSKQIRKPNCAALRHSKFEIRISDLLRTSSFGFRILFVAFILICLSVHAQVSNLKRDQDVVFFPTLACRSGSNCWDLDIHGCVYERDKRTVALALIRAALGL